MEQWEFIADRGRRGVSRLPDRTKIIMGIGEHVRAERAEMFFDERAPFDEVLAAVGEFEKDSIGHGFLGRRHKEYDAVNAGEIE